MWCSGTTLFTVCVTIFVAIDEIIETGALVTSVTTRIVIRISLIGIANIKTIIARITNTILI
jgi:hypothetical protein